MLQEICILISSLCPFVKYLKEHDIIYSALCHSCMLFYLLVLCGVNQRLVLLFKVMTFSCVLHVGALTVGLVKQCQTIHGRSRICISPSLPPEWVITLFFIILGIISLSITCGLLVISHWRREATKYARWIAFMASRLPKGKIDVRK